jgi:molecular chaperone GrpE
VTAGQETAGQEPVEESTTQGAADASAAPAGEPAEEPAPEAATEEPDPVRDLQGQLAERTLDLQRLQAEYVNYKRRVDRDRDLVRDAARASVLTAMVPVLDDIERARTHGELTGGFKAVAESLQRVLSGQGLDRYGEPGDPFDPRVHEALTHAYDDGVEQPTAQTIMQPGYRIGERIIRAALVGVVEPPVADTGSGLAEADIPEDEAGQTGPEGVGVGETDAETDQPPHF